MSAYLAESRAFVRCSHGARAQPMGLNLRVVLSGDPSVLIGTPYTIAGCPAYTSCVSGQWYSGTRRVLSAGQPLVVRGGGSVCVSSGSPMSVVAQQTRVVAS